MKLSILTLFMLFLSTSSQATEFKLLDFHRYGPSPGMEISLHPENGYKLSEIFRVLKFSNDKLSIRLIGTSSKKTNFELLQYYRDKQPKELDLAIKASGSVLHKPELKPLKANFSEALKATTLYSELINALNSIGYKIIDINFEKFHINIDGSISIPDTYIYIMRNA